MGGSMYYTIRRKHSEPRTDYVQRALRELKSVGNITIATFRGKRCKVRARH